MIFSRAEPTPDGSGLYSRYLSENGVWEVGFAQMLFGVRVRAGLADGCTFSVDYCAGPDRLFQAQLLAVVIRILEQYPENVSVRELENSLPTYQIRPINLDPCWQKLLDMASTQEHRHAG